MAIALTKQTIHDGERNAVILGKVSTDDASQLTDAVLVDLSALSNSPTSVKVMKIKAEATSTIHGWLEFDATADVAFHTIPQGANYEQCYRDVGGINNNAGSGVTGDITLTTLASAVGETMSILIWVAKKYD